MRLNPKKIGDTLTLDEYNALSYLLRENVEPEECIRLLDEGFVGDFAHYQLSDLEDNFYSIVLENYTSDYDTTYLALPFQLGHFPFSFNFSLRFDSLSDCFGLLIGDLALEFSKDGVEIRDSDTPVLNENFSLNNREWYKFELKYNEDGIHLIVSNEMDIIIEDFNVDFTFTSDCDVGFFITNDVSLTYLDFKGLNAVNNIESILSIEFNSYEVRGGGVVPLRVLLTDSEGEVIPGQSVNFMDTSNGISMGISITDDEGVAVLMYEAPRNTTGNINFKTVYEGNDIYPGAESADSIIRINSQIGSNIALSTNKTEIDYGERVILTGLLRDVNEVVLKGRNVKFYDGTKLIGSNLTDDSGYCSLEYAPVSDNELSCRFDGDQRNSSSISKTINVIVNNAPIFFDDCTGVNITDKFTIGSGLTAFYTTLNGVPCIQLNESTGYVNLTPKLNETMPTNFKMRFSMYRGNSATGNTFTLQYKRTDSDNRMVAGMTGNDGIQSLWQRNKGVTSDSQMGTFNAPGWYPFELVVINGVSTLTRTDTGQSVTITHKGLNGTQLFFEKGTAQFYLSNIAIWELEGPEPYLYIDDMSTDKRSDYVLDSYRLNFISSPPTITLDKNPTNITVNLQKASASANGEAYYLIKDFTSNSFKYEVTIEKTADFNSFSTVIFNETKDKAVLFQYSGASNTTYLGTMIKNGSNWSLTSIGSNNVALTNGEEYIFELTRENNTITSRFIQKSNSSVLSTRTGLLPSGFNDNVNIGVGFSNLTTNNNNISKTVIKGILADTIGGGGTVIFSDDCTNQNINTKYTASAPATVEYTTLSDTEGIINCIKATGNGRITPLIPDLDTNFKMLFDLQKAQTGGYCQLEYYNNSELANRSGYVTANTGTTGNCTIHKRTNGTASQLSSSFVLSANQWATFELTVINGTHTLKRVDTGQTLTVNDTTRNNGSVSFMYGSGTHYIKNIIIQELD